MRIAIVGGGISGLSCAYYLGKSHDITLFERNDHLGGHAHTSEFNLEGRDYAIDTAFVVFNRKTYPNFFKLLTELKVKSQPTKMSFSFSSQLSGFEYSSKGLSAFYLTWKNIFSWKRHYLLYEILKFHRVALRWLKTATPDSSSTFKEFFTLHRFSKVFLTSYLKPMISAIWSIDMDTIDHLSTYFLFQFFESHGLLRLFGLPWEVIQGGSVQYVRALEAKLKAQIFLNDPVLSIKRDSAGVIVNSARAANQYFDKVIIACHSDQAIRLLTDITPQEKEFLSVIPYQENEVVLHYDSNMLPKAKRTWSSWNAHEFDLTSRTCLTYYMNELQGISSSFDFCITFNKTDKIDPKKILQRFTYHHPVLHGNAVKGQTLLKKIQGDNHTYFCGAYLGCGFHEDGITSALAICHLLS